MKALELDDINTFYKKAHILQDVSLFVDEGELVTLLGRNGAGKSTTLHSVMGFTPARRGRVRIFGNESTRMATHRVVGLGVGFVPEGRRVFTNLTVADNLKVPIDRAGPWTVPRIYRLFPRLEERKANKGSQLSGGEQEMLSLARALLLNPKLLLLDEPSQGLAPLIAREVLDVIVAARAEGTSVLLIEQNVWAALKVADRVYVLDNGRIVYSGTIAEFKSDETRLHELVGVAGDAQGEEHPSARASSRHL